MSVFHQDTEPMDNNEILSFIQLAKNLNWDIQAYSDINNFPFSKSNYKFGSDTRFWFSIDNGFVNIFYLLQLKYIISTDLEVKLKAITDSILRNKPLPRFNINDVQDIQASTNNDNVNNHSHYGGVDNLYEAIKVIEAWDLGFNLGNTLMCISRAGKKDDIVQDLEEASWYLNREIAKLKK